MALDKNPARTLTSREIAKVVGSILGGMADWCDPKEIMDAVNHFHEHREKYKDIWEGIHEISKCEFPPIPGDE